MLIRNDRVYPVALISFDITSYTISSDQNLQVKLHFVVEKPKVLRVLAGSNAKVVVAKLQAPSQIKDSAPTPLLFCAPRLRYLCPLFRAFASGASANSVLGPSYRCSTLSTGRQVVFCRPEGGFEVDLMSLRRALIALLSLLPHSIVGIVLVVFTFLKIDGPYLGNMKT